MDILEQAAQEQAEIRQQQDLVQDEIVLARIEQARHELELTKLEERVAARI